VTNKLSATSYLRKAERGLDEARLLLREAATEGACSRLFRDAQRGACRADRCWIRNAGRNHQDASYPDRRVREACGASDLATS
jgi:hypothetical protein